MPYHGVLYSDDEYLSLLLVMDKYSSGVLGSTPEYSVGVLSTPEYFR